MWLFEKRGFTSTVAYDPKKDYRNTEHKKIAEASDDPQGWLLVRARVRADLESMEKVISEATSDPDYSLHLDVDPKADYSFRGLVSRDAMKAYLGAAVDGIDYGSHFKEVAEKSSTQGAARHSAMMTVWTAMARLQPFIPYSGSAREEKSSYSGGDYSYGGYHWGEGGTKNDGSGTSTGSGYRPWMASKSKPKVEFVPPAKVVTVAEMRDALVANAPQDVPQAIINGATDEAFELWLAAECSYANELSGEQADELVDELNDGLAAYEHAAPGDLSEAEYVSATGDVVADILETEGQ